ncbi:hypothetical protein F2Q70_00004320 [Brassica cretica]|uniref:Uncharacterized protein n=1 Tax=Brassica cretica TaxID=69181 RepID=A0A8S9IRP6_BRACR|nr:hypothetical protein F2Q70_00004320 [Brassica cretica]
MDFRPGTRRLNALSSQNPEAGWTFVQGPGGWIDYHPGTRRLDGLSSWNPEAGWTFVQEPRGWMNYRPGTRRLDGLSSWNPKAGWTIFLEHGGWILGSNGTVELLKNPETLLGPRGVVGIRRSFLKLRGCPRPGRRILEPARKTLNPEVDNRFGIRRLSKDPEVVWEPGGPEGRFEPGGCSRPIGRFGPEGRFELGGCSGPGGRLRSFGNLEIPSDPEALRSFQDPETAWGPEGTVLCLPRQDNYRYLFGFCIMPHGIWPLSSSYVVFYFCRKSLTDLEGAGMGVMTQVPGFAAFHIWRSSVLIAPWMDAGVGAGASLNRNLEAGASPGQDIAPVILLSQVLLRSGPCSNLGENRFPGDRPGSSTRFQVIYFPARKQEFLISDSHCSDKGDPSSWRRTSVAHSYIFLGAEWHMTGARKQIIDLLLAYDRDFPHTFFGRNETLDSSSYYPEIFPGGFEELILWHGGSVGIAPGDCASGSVEPSGIPSRSIGQLRGNRTFVGYVVLQFLVLLAGLKSFHFVMLDVSSRNPSITEISS